MTDTAGYSGTPLHRKLGVKEGHRVLALAVPAGWDTSVLSPDGAADVVVSAAPPAGKPGAKDTVLVVVQLTGGNDGLNTVIPFKNELYYKHRPTINSRPGPNDQTTIALAMLPADRFMALVAGPHQGTLLTRPVTFAGTRLMIDMEGSVPVDLERAQAGPAQAFVRSFDGAEVRVGLFDQSGGAIEGFSPDRCEPLFAGGMREVKWPGAALSKLRGRLVRLRFELRNAGLYGFQFLGG